jgi:Xaa-Pro aminopeptidase
MLERIIQFREFLEKWNVEGVLITSSTNRRWLSGFTGSAGSLLITPEKAILSTDSRYWEMVKRQAPSFTLFQHRNEKDDTLNFLRSAEVATIGIEAKHVSIAEWNNLNKLDGFEWKPLDTTVEELRIVKSNDEIDTIRAAAKITDQTIDHFSRIARPGMSERALVWELEKFMREEGADRPGFDIIVASGPNGALPHHQSGERELEEGDVIIVDLGADVRGYKSDLTRTFYLGSSADSRFWEVYNIVRKAQEAAISGLQPQMTGKEGDALARDVIVAAGFGDNFGHGTGHGVGLDIHEAPRLFRQGNKDVLLAGAVVTVEPGIYIPGWGGVRLEDLVHLTHNGSQLLSQAPKSPLIPIV